MWLLFSFLLSPQSFAQPHCQLSEVGNTVTVSCPDLNIKQTTFDNAHRMILQFVDGLQLELRVVREPKLKQFLLNPVSQTKKELSSQNVESISTVDAFLKTNGWSEKLPLLAFFKNLPANESLIPLMARSNEVPWPYLNRYKQMTARWGDFGFSSYTMICEYVGQELDALYTILDVDLVERYIVGDPETSCYGRCGFGCGGSPIYTQECLNHDACRRSTGENLGICSDYFWAAADGYLWAPSCDL